MIHAYHGKCMCRMLRAMMHVWLSIMPCVNEEDGALVVEIILSTTLKTHSHRDIGISIADV